MENSCGTRPKPERGPSYKVALDARTSDLNLTVDETGFVATPLTKDGFAYMWAGARATHGFTAGKVCYEVLVLEHLDVSDSAIEDAHSHLVRVGFSVRESSLQLGEDSLSFGFGGTGKIVYNGRYFQYGRPFTQGDVVTAFLFFDGDELSVSFALNGVHQGSALQLDHKVLGDRALYPHVISKNTKFQVNFAEDGKYFCNLPPGFQDYTFMGLTNMSYLEENTTSSQEDSCEVLMMCGLPGSGKSTWVRNHCKNNPKKDYCVLGTDTIMERMKMIGFANKNVYAERFEVLFQLANGCYEKMLNIASRTPRNYILDQTNVYPTAQKRKMNHFPNFHRVAIVVVPDDNVYRDRVLLQKEGGKIVPDEAVMKMKANFAIPTPGEVFHEVTFVELQIRRALALICKYNIEASQLGVRPNENLRRPQQVDIVAGFSNLDLNKGRQRRKSEGQNWSQRNQGQRGGENLSHRGGQSQRDGQNWSQRGRNQGRGGGQNLSIRGGQNQSLRGGQNQGQYWSQRSQNQGQPRGQNSGHHGDQSWSQHGSQNQGRQSWSQHGQNQGHPGSQRWSHGGSGNQGQQARPKFNESELESDSDVSYPGSSSGQRRGFRSRGRGRGGASCGNAQFGGGPSWQNHRGGGNYFL